MGKIFLNEWNEASDEAKRYCATLLDMPVEEVETIMEYFMQFEEDKNTH